MRSRWVRIGTAAFSAAWLGGLALALRIGATAHGVNPELLLGLLLASYLGAWGLVFFLSRRGQAGDAARFAACSASLAFVLAAFETPALLNVADYRIVFSSPIPPWKRPGNRPDPELLYVRSGHQRLRRVFQGNELPGLRGAVPWKTYRCDLRYDRNGFRNREPGPSADVVVLGDSFIEGLHVADDELLTTRLAARLGQAVVNLGRTGDGPQQELHILRRYGLEVRPKTCVWAFYEGNDLGDADRYEAHRKHVARADRESWTHALYGRSFTRNCLAFVIRTWLRPEPRRPARRFSGTFVDRSGARVPIYFGGDVRQDASRPLEPGGSSPGTKLIRSILEEAHALCQRQGIDLVVVFIPSKFRVYHDLCVYDRDAVCPSWRLDDLPRDLGDAVRSLSGGVGFLDLTPRLRAEAAGGALVYWPDDTHWSAEGHRASASAIAEYLTARRKPARAAAVSPTPAPSPEGPPAKTGNWG